jgi:hypothetical protein
MRSGNSAIMRSRLVVKGLIERDRSKSSPTKGAPCWRRCSRHDALSPRWRRPTLFGDGSQQARRRRHEIARLLG